MATKKKEEPVKTNDKPLEGMAKLMASQVVANISKKYGGGTLIKASDERNQTVQRIPTDIFTLDYALGGGFAAGRVHTCYGHKSSAKTTVFLKTLANAQKMCANCFKSQYITSDGEVIECGCGSYRDMVAAFIDVEGTFDVDWASKVGVNLDRMLYSRPNFAEEALDISEALLRGGDVDILILDSLAFLTPSKEIEDSVEKETMGVQSRLIGKFVRKINAGLSAVKQDTGRLPTVFFTNQIRMKIGVMFGNPETTPGGHAPGFVSTSEIRTRAAKYDMDDVTGKPNHVDIEFKIEKNKAGPPKMEGGYRIILSDTEHKKMGSIYDEHEIVKFAEKCGLIEGRGNSWTCMGEKFGGRSLIEKELVTNPAFKRRVRETLMKALLQA